MADGGVVGKKAAAAAAGVPALAEPMERGVKAVGGGGGGDFDSRGDLGGDLGEDRLKSRLDLAWYFAPLLTAVSSIGCESETADATVVAPAATTTL